MDPDDLEFTQIKPVKKNQVQPSGAKAWGIFSVLAGLTPILCFYPFAILSMGIMGLSEGEGSLLNLGWIMVMASPILALISGAINLHRLQGKTGLPRNLSVLGCVLGGLMLLLGLFVIL